LIKVGALNALGPRTALLDTLDRITALSASHFKAADTGQLSLFGSQTGLVAKIELPPVNGDISRREQLNWERDLIGLYVSDHPLSPVMEAIQQNITHSAGELVEAQEQQVVRVAGLITRIRPHTTKKGEPMGFVTIEDFQGNIELVVFPRTWARYQELFQWDNIIMVDGKVDTRSAEPKVLVDSVTMELNHVTPLKESPSYRTAPTQQRRSNSDQRVTATPEKEPAPKPKSAPVPSKQAAEPAPGFDLDWQGDDSPPPPEAFPMGWSDANGIVLEPSKPVEKLPLAADSKPKQGPIEESVKLIVEKPVVQEPGAGLSPIAEVQPQLSAEPIQTESEPLLKVLEKLPPPIVSPMRADSAEDVRMVTIILRPKEDKARDKLLLRRIFGIMISHPGNDRFAFHIFERGRGHLLEFPNLTTGLGPELIAQLHQLVGTENVRIEPITFQ
jgi:DNA polymerase-3 subunit alpha